MKTETKLKTGTETVLVTGAAGTVGAFVVQELLKAGHRVIAADRPGSRWELPPGAREKGLVDVREGDLTDLSFAVDAIAGAHSVIHTAATIDLTQPYEVQARINVDAVRWLYEAGRARGVRRFVHFSSGSVYRKTSPVDETAPFDPMSPYELTKVEAERYLWSRPRSGPEVTILRPTLIYGPRARFLAARFAAIPPMLALAFSRLPRLRGMPRCNWAHAEDVARAAVFLCFEKRAAWEAYNVADEKPTEIGEFLEIIGRAYGFEMGREVRYPRRIMGFVGPLLAERDLFLRAATLGAERVWRFICERHGLTPAILPGIDREALLYATRDAVFDTAKLRALGFECKYKTVADGYPDVLRWFQERRWAPTYDRATLAAGEWGGGTGFGFEETMAGTWRRGGAGEPRPFSFKVAARAANARQFARDGILEIEGAVTADGLARGRPLAGTLDISWRKRRTLEYEFGFTGDDGTPYWFSGRKDVRLLSLIETTTTLPGKIFEGASKEMRGAEVGTAVAYFDLRRDLLALVGSFQATGAPAPRAAAPAAP